MAEHRVSMLRSALSGHDDPARSKDPLVRAIVTQLATLEVAPPARAHFRAELRAQLVAVAPRLVAEGDAELAAVTRPARHAKKAKAATTATAPERSTRDEIRSGFRLGRPLALIACTVVVLSMLLGGAFIASRKALPGDALYGVKRASENLRMATTSGDTDRAKLSLSFASTRLTEVSDLLPKSVPSKHTASLVSSTLGSADSDIRTASQTLGAEAVRDNSAAPLNVITAWAPGALGRLTTIINRLPAGPLRDRAVQSYQLLSSGLARAQLLEAEAGCACLHSAPSDQLGPIPCPVCASSSNPAVPNGSNVPTIPGVTSPTGKPGAGATGSASTTNPGLTGSGGGTGPGATQGSTPTATKPGNPLPTLPPLPTTLPPLPSASLGPIGVGSCGLSASLSPINIVLGTCGVHLHI